MRRVLIACLGLALSACATGPKFPVSEDAKAVTPNQMLATPEPGKRVVWGGMIVAATNLSDRTRLEILGYPLDAEQKPDTSAPAQARFLADKAGYLETADYANGRLVTILGETRGIEKGRIGEADYTYPLLRAEQLHLWPRPGSYDDTAPRIHFGFGLVIGN